jgi:5-methylcytosine-specific restriction protein A
MKFSKVQEQRLGTKDGAYSVVTSREFYDSQITLTDYEAELVLSHFGKSNIHIGNVKSNLELASKTLRLYPSGTEIRLNIVFPKPEKTELRLYLSAKSGFKPNGGEIWFIFQKDNDLWVGAMPENKWRKESSNLKQDEFDTIYQNSLEEDFEAKTTTIKSRDIYSRDRRIALKRFELSGFICEYDPSHQLFVSRFSRKPYLEAHHLVPMALQGDFNKKLDTVHNVFCLCPYCHRAVHHAEEGFARDILAKLVKHRSILDSYSLSLTDLFSLYAVEEID